MIIHNNDRKKYVKINLVTCYCPVRGTYPGSLYSQHLLRMSNNKDIPENIVCPRQLFEHNLKIMINKKLMKGIR